MRLIPPRPLTAPLALGTTLLLSPALAAADTSPSPPAALPPQTPAALPPPPRSTVQPLPHSPALADPVRPLAPKGSSPLNDVRRLSETLADVAEKVSPSVVQIDVTVGEALRPELRWLRGNDMVRRGLGSGVIFSPDGAVLTNNHVIEEARSITVRLRDGRVFPARIAGRDPSTDLAVLRVDAKSLPAVTFADSDSARVGEWVLAIGSPFGLGHTVTSGVLSAKGRGGVGINAVEDYLQTDASINPGNSGGPLVNLDGKVLGINTMIVSRGQGIGMAVPANMARRVAEQILKIGRVERAYIGLGMQDLTPQLALEIPAAPPSGALVNAVAPSGPASRARVEPGDVISAIGGKTVHDAQDVIREVFLHNAGDTLSLEVIRGGKRLKLNVTLSARNEAAPKALPAERKPSPEPGLGLSLRDASEGGQKGAIIAKVAPDSAADRAGLKTGDVVLEADGAREPSAAEIMAAAQDGRLLLRVQRRGTVFYAAIRR